MGCRARRSLMPSPAPSEQQKTRILKERCGFIARNFLVPTARLELAQLSPLPPQDSVSTNFTTSANFCQKSHAFLESRTFYHAIGASRQFVTPRRSAPAAAGPPPLPAQQALTSRAAPGINLSCRPAILASPCAHPGPSPGEFPPDIHMKGNSLARMPGRLTMPAIHNRASGP